MLLFPKHIFSFFQGEPGKVLYTGKTDTDKVVQIGYPGPKGIKGESGTPGQSVEWDPARYRGLPGPQGLPGPPGQSGQGQLVSGSGVAAVSCKIL